MPQNPTLTREIQKLWKKCPRKYRLTNSKGRTLLEMARAVESEFNSDIRQLKNWDKLLMEITSWFLVCTMAHQEALIAQHRRKKDPSHELSCFVVILGSIVNHSIAISDLCLKGLDVPAKQVLRSMLEYCELLALFDANPSIMKSFHTAQSPEEANAFWHANLSRGKARKVILSSLSPEMLKYSESMREWWNDQKSVLGASAHPSFGGSFAAFTSLARGNVAFGYLGKPARTSIRTLNATIHALFETALYTRSLLFWRDDVPNRIIKFDRRSKTHWRVRKSWPVIVSIFAWTIESADSPLLRRPKAWPDGDPALAKSAPG